ncbi:MAG: peptidase domain-containing ABC transporter [Firmicutes bacterium]|nr:peptidase domain-containing ABC transporter [Bacillota bacterium]
MKKKIPVIKQEGIKDCGAACLLSIIRYYGGDISLEKLRELTKTTKIGTTAYHIIRASEKLEFSSKGIKCKSLNDLKNKINVPFIAHLVINKSYKHYVVVYDLNYKKNIVTIMDPNSGVKKLTFDEFNKMWSKVIITLYPTKKIPIYKTNKSVNNLIKYLILNNKKVFVEIILLSLFITMFNIINSYYFKIIVDDIVVSSINNFYIISFVFIILILLKSLSEYFRNQLILYSNQKIDFQLFTKTFNHVINLPYDYFKNKTTGEILSRISDLNHIKDAINKIIVTIFVDLLLILISSTILLTINKDLFLITIIIFILYLIVALIFSPIYKNLINLSQEKNAQINSKLIESINSFETIKSMNLQNNVINKIENQYVDNLYVENKVNTYHNIQQTIKDLIGGIGLFMILFIGYLKVMNGVLSVGDLITYNSLLIYFLTPIKNILELEPLIRYALSSFKRINELYEIDNEKLEIDNKYIEKRIIGNIKYKDFNYSINDRDLILNKINLNIEKGNKVMIVGNSGCGKSTLLKSLLKYYKIKRDKIFIDDKDINDYNTKQLRENITYVSQNETVFTDSIFNNIVLNRKIDYDKFLKFVKITEVDKICNDRYLGYDTLLEENGFNVSGGERNRIILCRALINSANIILLDEALNEIDVNMERRILKRIFKDMKDKTIIVVSHRLENMDLYDKVINVENGSIKNVIERKDK